MEFTVEISEIIRNFTIALAAVIAFPLAIWRSYIAYRNSVIASKNHLTDTYTKAIDQLGHTDESCRIGGLYALEKIALHNIDYHPQVIEVICAFIRTNQRNHDERGNRKEIMPGGQVTSVMVQAALDILRRRNLAFERKGIVTINLESTDLSNYSLEGASLKSSTFTCCNLSKTNLRNADLRFSSLNGIDWQNVDLEGANLEGANLFGTGMWNVDLSKVKNLSCKQIHDATIDKKKGVPELPEHLTIEWQSDEKNYNCVESKS